jgi:hypothetical protein
MSPHELGILKSHIDKAVKIETREGEQLIARVIFVFEEPPNAEVFYQVISSSKPFLYKRQAEAGGYSLPLEEITSVSALEGQCP